MDSVVVLGSRLNGVIVRDLDRTGQAPPNRALIEVTGPGLSATRWVDGDPDFSRLLEFLASVERDWRGWAGSRRWTKPEGQMVLTAVHTGAHVRAEATLERVDRWKVCADVVIGPGEDITNALRTARELFE